MLYFAYGSNMSRTRLEERVGSVGKIAICKLYRHCLQFHKVGRDNSAKCDALFTGNPEDFLYGVLYRLGDQQKVLLDGIEGVGNGYEEKSVSVISEDEIEYTAVLYCATNTDKGLPCFRWYLIHVLKGAEEANLPLWYRDQISSIKTVDDWDNQREKRELEIYSGTL